MPCTPRTPDGRTTAKIVVYPSKGKRIEVSVGATADVRIPKKDLVEQLKSVSPEDLKNFPKEVHLVMTPEKIVVSDIFKEKEVVKAEFYKDDLGWKMKKEYDELSIWLALFRGLMKNEINLIIFYETMAREGLYS